MEPETESPGVYTAQIIIAPAYHNDLLDEAKATGRTIDNIMASRVEQHTSLKAEIERLQGLLENIANSGQGFTEAQIKELHSILDQDHAAE